MPNLGIIASQISGHLWAPSNSYDSIATYTGSGASSVTFSSIPSTYRHLQLRLLVRMASGTGGTDNMAMQFNSDTTNTNYASHSLRGSGTSAVAESYTTSYPIILRDVVPRDGLTASVYGALVIDILDYASTNKNKTVRTLSGNDSNGAGTIAFTSGLWMNSASAISSIKLYDYDNSGYNFASNCSFALYGVK